MRSVQSGVTERARCHDDSLCLLYGPDAIAIACEAIRESRQSPHVPTCRLRGGHWPSWEGRLERPGRCLGSCLWSGGRADTRPPSGSVGPVRYGFSRGLVACVLTLTAHTQHAPQTFFLMRNANRTITFGDRLRGVPTLSPYVAQNFLAGLRPARTRPSNQIKSNLEGPNGQTHTPGSRVMNGRDETLFSH